MSVGFGFPLVWGILSRSMPRLAGECSDSCGTLGIMAAGAWLFAAPASACSWPARSRAPDKTLISADIIAILVPALFMTWTALSTHRTMPCGFMSAAAWIDDDGIDGHDVHSVPSNRRSFPSSLPVPTWPGRSHGPATPPAAPHAVHGCGVDLRRPRPARRSL